MLSRDECTRIDQYDAAERHKWRSLACVNKDTLKELCDTASDLLKFPNNKDKQMRMIILLKEIHEEGIYDVDTVMQNLKD